MRYLAFILLFAGFCAQAKTPAAKRRVAEEAASSTASASESVSPEMDSLITSAKKMQVHFNNLSSNAGRERLMKGGVFFAATGYLLGVYIAQDRLLTGEFKTVAKGVVGTTGIIFGAAGLATLLLPDAAEEGADRFRSIAGKNEKQLRDKLILGEGELRRYAERAKINRRFIGGGFLAVGVADAIWFLGTGENPNLAFLPYLGGLYGALGTLLLTFESAAEMEYQDYLKEKELARDSGLKLSIYPTYEPTYAAPGIGLALTF